MVIPFSVDRSSDKRIAREGTSDVGYHPDWNRFSRLSTSRRTPFVVLSRVLDRPPVDSCTDISLRMYRHRSFFLLRVLEFFKTNSF